MGKKHISFSETGTLTGRYDSSVHGASIPVGAIEVSEGLFERTIREDDGVWRLVDGEVIKEPAPLLVPDYKAQIADERYSREIAGLTLSGLSIETTRDSQSLIASAGLSSILDPQYHCNFKTLDGFVQIDASQILDIAKAVRAHVQACFDRELDLLNALESGTYTDEMLKEGWPDSSAAPSIPAPQ